MPRLKRVVMSGSLGCILGGKDGSWSLPLLRESQFRSLAEFGRRRTRGHDALCRTPITRCSLLQFDLRRRDCWQPLGVDPHQTWQFHRLRFPAAMDERSRKRPCPADLADKTVLIGCMRHGDSDGRSLAFFAQGLDCKVFLQDRFAPPVYDASGGANLGVNSGKAPEPERPKAEAAKPVPVPAASNPRPKRKLPAFSPHFRSGAGWLTF